MDRDVAESALSLEENLSASGAGKATEEEYVRRGFWPKLKRVLNKLPLAGDALALYYAAFDEKTPKWARRIAVGALVYFIMPLDLIPDYLIIPGYTDDASVLALAIASLKRYVTDSHRQQAQDWLKR
jgi:uncharacterized membrane protein YkvA (DUF1232 family)